MANICVFCASNSDINQEYFDVARKVGILIAKEQDVLVYGGGRVGLMGHIARTVKAGGGKVTGILTPEVLGVEGEAGLLDERIVARDFSDRLSIMEKRSNAIIALAGGLGTFSEFYDVLLHKQFGYHNNPIVLLNTRGFYDFSIKQIDHAVEEGMISPHCKELFHVSPNVIDAFDHIDNYRPKKVFDKVRYALAQEIERKNGNGHK